MKKRVLYTVSILSIFIIGFTTYFYSNNENDQKVNVQEVHGDFVMDVTNKNEVVGNSENVFLGKVIKQVGTESPNGEYVPRTQFGVQVLKNIKGELKGNEIINQSAGYVDDENGDKTLVKFENQELLEPGKVYLFATMYSEQNNWHNPVPGYGEVLVKDAAKQQVISEYMTAFKQQVISDIMQRNKDKDFVNGYVEN